MRLLRAIQFAGRGLAQALRRERNLRIQTAVALIVLFLGWRSGLSPQDWALLALATGLVLSAELMNTAVEALADALHPERHPGIGLAKDIAAAAVLLAALTALSVGLLVFLPHWSHP
jgi:diacylglycerol kinase (ATP)